MRTRQTVAVIGATGPQGAAIASGIAKGNYRVLLCDEDSLAAEALADSIRGQQPAADVEAAHCNTEAAWEADIIVLALPCDEAMTVAGKICTVSNRKVVVSTASGEALERAFPDMHIVSAFGSLPPDSFRLPDAERSSIDTTVVGEDPESVAVAAGLVAAAGFNPVTRLTRADSNTPG